MNDQLLDELVTEFYRAATGAMDWNEPLKKLRAAFNARVTPLQSIDTRTGTLVSLHDGAPDMQEAELAYIREYHRIDPRARISMQLPVGEWAHCHEHFDDEFAAHDRFYQEFLTSYDSRYVSGLVIPLSPDIVSILGIQRSVKQGPLSQDERQWAQRLGVHLREALLAYERVRKMAAQALAGHALLSTFPYPMWLIDANRYVFFSNALAQRETDAENRVALVGSRLSLIKSQSDRDLTLRLVEFQNAPNGASAVIDLRRSLSDPPTWLHLSMLVPGQVLGAFGDKPQILATLFDPMQISHLDPFALANMFSLTPTEAKVATQVAEGLTTEEIAQRNSTRMATVRTQIRNVLNKLGVSRQSDVVRILRQGESLWSKASG